MLILIVFLHAFKRHSFGLGLRVGARVRLCNFHVVRRQQEIVALGACAWSSIDILSFSTAADPLPGIAPALYQHQRWVEKNAEGADSRSGRDAGDAGSTDHLHHIVS